jgi:tetratricopeptide (TPR) repeat protein
MARSKAANPESGLVRPRPAPPLSLRLLLLVAAPAVVFCGLEGALRLGGYGASTDLFIPDGKPGFFRTNPNFTAPFIPASFGIEPLSFRIRRHKEANSIRVFVLGESAAQGLPDPDFGFAAQLRAQLRARFPGRNFEVCNLGITAINSHVVYRVVRQAARFEPDLLVIYMGNNEVVGPYGPGCAYLSSAPPLWLIRASVWVRSTRTGQLLERFLGSLAPAGAKPKDWKGMETFAGSTVRGDDPRLEAVYRNFSSNLQDIVDFAGRRGIKVVLATVVANLRDSPPFVSLHREGLSPADEKAWNAAFGQGTIAWDLGDAKSAMYEYEEALRLDPGYAETHFRLGRLSEELGEPAQALAHYLGALHWDALRFRPDTRMNEIIRHAAQGAGSPVLLVDAAREMGSDPGSGPPIAGHDVLFDHVHFTWEGNHQLAQLLAGACARQLFGPDANPGGGLDSQGCASALGYTRDAQVRMLKVIVQMTLRPPFTGQSTFTEDQAQWKRDIELINAGLAAPQARDADAAEVEVALQLDPDNASLAVHLGILEADAGHLERALELLDRAGAAQPRSVEADLRRARILIRLQRFDEAEALLQGPLEMADSYFYAGDALVELWGETRQFDKGTRFFAEAAARAPANHYLRLEYAQMLARSGDWAGAEREARRIWDEDPGSRPAMSALELLVRMYEGQGKAGAAEAMTVEARPHQPDDYFNNQRLLRIDSAKNDPAGVVDCLRALEASGPFDSAQHLDLAHRLADLHRTGEMLDELHHAGEVARIEDNGPRTQAVEQMIGIYRQRLGEAQAR